MSTSVRLTRTIVATMPLVLTRRAATHVPVIQDTQEMESIVQVWKLNLTMSTHFLFTHGLLLGLFFTCYNNFVVISSTNDLTFISVPSSLAMFVSGTKKLASSCICCLATKWSRRLTYYAHFLKEITLMAKDTYETIISSYIRLLKLDRTQVNSWKLKLDILDINISL